MAFTLPEPVIGVEPNFLWLGVKAWGLGLRDQGNETFGPGASGLRPLRFSVSSVPPGPAG